jgi:mannan endo-1,4-beta-mannosidase
LDFVLAEARKYGIKVILSLVNNYDNFGGKKQYVEWARSQGQSINSEDDFFTNSVVKGYYKNHIKVNFIFIFILPSIYYVYFLVER